MDPETNEEKLMKEKLQARFLQLPKALQNAITSADIEKKLRRLSETHKLHIDQWQKLENEVMLALLGFQPVEKLEENIKNEVGMTGEEAKPLAGDIAEVIFEPIRVELEKELGETETEEEKISAEANADLETAPGSTEVDMRVANVMPSEKQDVQPIAINKNPISVTSAQTIIESAPPRSVEAKTPPPVRDMRRDIQGATAAPAPVASTPPAAPPAAKSVRATLSPAYAPDSKSHERTTIDDDPYREAIG
jgi:hypothetical protein